MEAVEHIWIFFSINQQTPYFRRILNSVGFSLCFGLSDLRIYGIWRIAFFIFTKHLHIHCFLLFLN